MTDKQGKARHGHGRRLPEWYSEKVNMAREVFSGAPQGVDMRIPHVKTQDTGAGVAAQRQGGVAAAHKPVTRQWLATPSYRRGYAASFHPPAPATPVKLDLDGQGLGSDSNGGE